MKRLIRGLIWVVAVIVVIFLAANLAFFIFGKKIITRAIAQNLKLPVSLESVSLSFPTSLRLRNLEIKGLAKVQELSLSPSILGLLAGKVVLNDLLLVCPQLILQKQADGTLNLPALQSPAAAAKGKAPPLLLAGLNIQQGKFIFIDKQINPDGHRIIVDNINVHIAKRTIPPTSLYTNFKISADLWDAQDKPTGVAAASGWVDFGPKDMQGRIEISQVDISAFLPYLQGVISSKKLLSAKLSLQAELKAQHNDLVVPCHMELNNIVYKQETPAEGQPKEIDLVSQTIDLFSDAAGKMVFNFTFHTKLDKPAIDTNKLRGIFAQSAIENIVRQSPEELAGKLKTTMEDFKDFGKSFKKMFKKEE